MTVTKFVRVQPRDPLIARDGRPFGADSGSRMRSGTVLPFQRTTRVRISLIFKARPHNEVLVSE